MDWLSTMVPAASVVVGAAITMMGQALGDRRAWRRERDARREDFRAKNFEMHRDALMRLQEMSLGFTEKIWDEKKRRELEGDYAFWDSAPAKSAFGRVAAMYNLTQIIRQSTSDLERAGSRAQVRNIVNELLRTSKSAVTAAREVAADNRRMASAMMKRTDFVRELDVLGQNYRVYAYRAGSVDVIEAANAHLAALHEWSSRLVSEGADELLKAALSARDDLLVAIGRALKKGPFEE